MANKPPGYDYRVVRLPAFPQFPLVCALEYAAGRLWFPVKATCSGLRLDYTSQLAKLQAPRSEYRQYLGKVRLPTVKGYREATCIEWQGFGMWIAGLQEQRVGDDVKQYLTLYKRQVFAAANVILLQEPGELAERLGVYLLPEAAGQLPTPARGGALQTIVREHEDRLARLEDMLAQVGDDVPAPAVTGSLAASQTTCPHCGGLLRIETGPMRVVATDEADSGQ